MLSAARDTFTGNCSDCGTCSISLWDGQEPPDERCSNCQARHLKHDARHMVNSIAQLLPLTLPKGSSLAACDLCDHTQASEAHHHPDKCPVSQGVEYLKSCG